MKMHFAILTTILLLVSVWGGGMAQEEQSENRLSLCAYLENSKTFVENNGTAIAADVITALASMYPESTAVDLAVCSLPQEKDSLAGRILWQAAPYTVDHQYELYSAVAQLEHVLLTSGADQMRRTGVQTAAELLKQSEGSQKLLLFFTTNDRWQNVYSEMFSQCDFPVHFVQLAGKRAVEVPDECATVEPVFLMEPYGENLFHLMKRCAEQTAMYPVQKEQFVLEGFYPESATLDKAFLPEYSGRKILLTGHIPHVGKHVLFSGNHLQVLSFERFQDWAPVQLNAGCGIICIDRMDEYRVIPLNQWSAAVNKNEPIKFVCEVARLTTSEAKAVEDWEVSLVITNPRGIQERCPAVQDADTRQYIAQPALSVSGDHTYFFEAASASGVVLRSDAGSVQVSNVGPVPLVDQARMQIWKQSPVALPAPALDLSVLFDDDDKVSLNYQLDERRSGAGIVDQTLMISEENIGDKDFSIVITARDLEGESASVEVCLAIEVISDMLARGTLEMDRSDVECSKGETVWLQGSYAFSENGRDYLNLLEQHQLTEVFLSDLSAVFAIEKDGTEIALVPAEMTFVAEDGHLLFEAEMKEFLQTGDYQAKLMLDCAAVEDYARISSETMTLHILNAAPVLMQSCVEGQLILPDFLGGDPSQLKQAQEIDLASLIQGEIGDVLTIRYMTDGEDPLYLLDEGELGYYITDVSGENLVQGIQWDLSQEAPKLQIRLTKPVNSMLIQLSAEDQDGATMEGTVQMQLSAVTLHHRQLHVAMLAVLGVLLLTVLILIICWTIRPSFANIALEMQIDGAPEIYVMPAKPWKKKALTLWEVLFYMAPAITEAFPVDECRYVSFLPGKGDRFILVRQKKSRCRVCVDGQELANDKLCLELHKPVVLTVDPIKFIFTVKRGG